MHKRTATKAQLDPDPVRSGSRRQEKVQAFARDMNVTALEKRVLAAEDANRKLEETLRSKEAAIDQLENDRRWLADREKEERETRDSERTRWRQEKASLEQQLQKSRDSSDITRRDLDELQDGHALLQRKYNAILAKYDSQLELAARKTGMLEEQLKSANASAEKNAEEVNRLQGELDEGLALRIQDSRRGQEEQNWNIIREELHKQAAYTQKLDTENNRLLADIRALRSRAETVEVLREEKLSLEKKLRNAEQFRDQVAQLQAELDAARKERAEWAQQRTATPSQVVSELTELRLQYASLLESHGVLRVELHQKEAELAEADVSAKEMTEVVTRLQANVTELSDAAAKRERRVALAEREVNFLNAMLATFNVGEEGAPHESEEAQANRIRHLEEVVEGYRIEIRELEQQVRALTPKQVITSNLVSQTELANNEIQKSLRHAQEVVQRQENKIEELEQTLFELRGTIAQGNHVPPKARVLSMQGSPLHSWEELQRTNLDKLKAENLALLKRLAELKASGSFASTTDDLLPRESFDRLEHENDQLREAVAQKQKRFDRLKEVYTAKSQEFKDAVSMLLGFKLTFFPNGQCKATSIYDVSAKFTFGPSEEDKKTLTLIDGGRVAGLNMESVVNNYLIQRGSIPCFLAAITLECQDQYTGGRTGYTESFV